MRASNHQEDFPSRLVIVSHAFKKRRFLELHLPALRFPIENVEYIGIDPCFATDPDGGRRRLQEIVKGDHERGYGVWKEDLYGTRDPLSSKKTQRGWTRERRQQVLAAITGKISPEAMLSVERLLDWDSRDSATEIFPEPLPWGKEIRKDRLLDQTRHRHCRCRPYGLLCHHMLAGHLKAEMIDNSHDDVSLGNSFAISDG